MIARLRRAIGDAPPTPAFALIVTLWGALVLFALGAYGKVW